MRVDLILLIEISAIVLALVALFVVKRTIRRIDENIESLVKMLDELMKGWEVKE